MNRVIILSSAILATIQGVSAHASIRQPKPIQFDEQRGNYNAPLAPDFSNFPCKGFHNQPFNSVETWVAGQDASFTIDTSHMATHNGGSCQASISHDGGKTFQVVHSFIGDCPRDANGNDGGPNQQFSFKVPDDEPAGEALFAWTWFPSTANREMYMNCAFITIENNGPSTQSMPRPEMFVGFLAPGACAVDQQTNLEFPNPGPSVTDGSQNNGAPFKGKTKPFGSDCGNAASGGGETIRNSLPPNEQLASSGNSRPNPNPNPNPGQNLPDGNTEQGTTTAAPDAPAPTNNNNNNNDGNAIYITVTETVTNAATDVVYVTSTTIERAVLLVNPTGAAKVKREAQPIPQEEPAVVARQDTCNFQAEVSVGNVCSVPSTMGSTWEDCVWTQFCGCLDDKLDPADLVNFGEVKRYCNCFRFGRDCPTANRFRRRQLGAPSLVLPRIEAKKARAFKA